MSKPSLLLASLAEPPLGRTLNSVRTMPCSIRVYTAFAFAAVALLSTASE